MPRFTTLLARPVFALAATAAVLTGAAPAMAASTETVPTVLIRLNAADLSAGDSATTIHSRIATAARSVCAPLGRTLKEQTAARQCYAKAVHSAELQLVAQRQQAKARQQTLATAAR